MTSESPTQPNPRALLLDLESRQDEVLRLLDDLERRTAETLARLGGAEAAAAAPSQSPQSPPRRSSKAA